MPVFLLKPSAASKQQNPVEADLRATIQDLVEVQSLRDIPKSIRGSVADQPIAIALLSNSDRHNFEQLVEFANHNSSEVFIVLIGDEISASDYKRVIRSGGADWVAAHDAPAEVLEIITRRRRSERDSRAASPHRSVHRAVTLSFVPSAGGVGNSTLVLETAAQLKREKATQQRNICIVDLDFQTSHICDYLDSEARLQMEELSSAPERLDEHLFDSFRTRHGSGIDVFAAPRSKFSWEALNLDALDALFTMIATRYDLVLIDYPVPWFPWTPQIVAASDGVVVTGINTIPCLRQICETLTLVRSSGSTALQVAIAINRCEYGMLGSIARRKQAQMVLRDERVFFIANRPEAIESVNMGQPMMLGTAARKLRKDLQPLAIFCAGLQSSRAPAI